MPKFTFRHSAAQGIAGIADQGFFAISNFALNLILARRMTKVDFGAFSAAFATFLILSTIYVAFVTEPMLVFALSSRIQQQRSYVKRVSALHWKAAGLVSIALALIGAVRYIIHPEVTLIHAYAGWAIAAPSILWLWFARRTAYITRTPHRAAIAGVAYLLCMTVLLEVFGGVAAEYPIVACILFAVPSLIIAQLLRITVPLQNVEDAVETHFSDMWNPHWDYGRWASLGGVCFAITSQIYFFVLPLDGCASYRAIMNIPMPLLQSYTALGVVFISLFTPLRGKSQFRHAVAQALIVLSSAALVLGLSVAFFGKDLLRILYSDKYTAYSAALWPLMICSCLVSAIVVLDSAMRSMGRVRTATVASVAAAIVSIVVGVPAALTYGVTGAVYGLLGSELLTLSVLLFVCIKIPVVSIDGRPVTIVRCVDESREPERIYNDV